MHYFKKCNVKIILMQVRMGESMVKYTKILDKKISSFLKNRFFLKTQESRLKFYINFNLKLLSPHSGLL